MFLKDSKFYESATRASFRLRTTTTIIIIQVYDDDDGAYLALNGQTIWEREKDVRKGRESIF